MVAKSCNIVQIAVSQSCFNPCSGGLWLLRTPESRESEILRGFNPCSGGLWLLSEFLFYYIQKLLKVSILVLVDYGC